MNSVEYTINLLNEFRDNLILTGDPTYVSEIIDCNEFYKDVKDNLVRFCSTLDDLNITIQDSVDGVRFIFNIVNVNNGKTFLSSCTNESFYPLDRYFKSHIDKLIEGYNHTIDIKLKYPNDEYMSIVGTRLDIILQVYNSVLNKGYKLKFNMCKLEDEIKICIYKKFQ